MSQVKINSPNFLIVHRLPANLHFEEFKKVVSHIGKPKSFVQLARTTETLLKSVLIGFDSVQDKRYFMNVFKIVFPDFIVQELSKVLKIFVMNLN